MTPLSCNSSQSRCLPRLRSRRRQHGDTAVLHAFFEISMMMTSCRRRRAEEPESCRPVDTARQSMTLSRSRTFFLARWTVLRVGAERGRHRSLVFTRRPGSSPSREDVHHAPSVSGRRHLDRPPLSSPTCRAAARRRFMPRADTILARCCSLRIYITPVFPALPSPARRVDLRHCPLRTRCRGRADI